MLSRRDFVVLCGGLVQVPFLNWDGLSVPGIGTSPSAPSLPSWFERARVQALTGMGGVWTSRPVFERTGAAARALGATVLTRYVKWNATAPFWSPAGLLTPTGKQTVGAMIEEAHHNGVRLILYYWHEGDDGYAATHPDVYCRMPNGDIASHPVRGRLLDVTDPGYGTLVKARLNEMAGLGADGFYFDYMHLPPAGCLDTQLERTFTSDGGPSIPRNAVRDDEPAYHAFLGYTARRVAATFEDWKASVHARSPDTLFIISATYLPSLVSNRMNTDLVRAADSPKTEFYVAVRPQLSLGMFERGKPLGWVGADERLVMGYCYLRDAGAGRPPHVWAPGFLAAPEYPRFVAAVLAFGCIAAVNLPEPLLNDSTGGTEAERDGIPAAFALGRRLSEQLEGTHPLRWLVVHVSERARDARGADIERACREVIAPEIGAFVTGLHLGVPVGVVTDSELAAGVPGSAKVLFLPDPATLHDRQRAAVARFRQDGGTVVHQDGRWDWTGNPAAAERALGARLEHVLGTVPLLVTSRSGRPFAAAHASADGKRLVIGVTTAFSGLHLQSGQAVPGAVPAPGDLTGVDVWCRQARPITRAQDVVRGTVLNARRRGDAYVVTLPLVRPFAFIAIQTE